MDRLKIGITNTSYGVYSFEEAIERIASQGYDCIDYQGFVNIESDFFKLPDTEFEAEILRQKELIASHGLEVTQAHAPWRTPKDGDPEERRKWLEAMKKAIRGTKLIGCSRFVVHPLLPYMDTAEHPDEVWAMNEEFLGALADYAKDYGVTVCFENMPFPAFPITTVEHCMEMLDRLKRDNLKICLDTGHAAIFKGSDVASAVRLIGDRLEAVHIHDNMGKEDEHLIPGDGIIDWDALTAALKEIGFKKVFSLETSPKHTKHPREEWEAREINLVNLAKDLATKAF
jgi:sugar phosphate isomerase/epimerase